MPGGDAQSQEAFRKTMEEKRNPFAVFKAIGQVGQMAAIDKYNGEVHAAGGRHNPKLKDAAPGHYASYNAHGTSAIKGQGRIVGTGIRGEHPRLAEGRIDRMAALARQSQANVMTKGEVKRAQKGIAAAQKRMEKSDHKALRGRKAS